MEYDNNMYINHSCLPLNHSDSKKIWRYMDFAKFVNLLDTESLFFCRADGFEDEWEGTFPKGTIDKYNLNKKFIKSNDGNKYSLCEWQNKKEVRSHLINCWHVNDYESDAMWKLYSSNRQSIAIQSTIGRLKRCFKKTAERIWIGEVEYGDFKILKPNNRVFNMGEPNILKTFFLKRKEFEHEKEIRAITNIAYNRHKQEKGILVDIDLNELVETIVIPPNSEDRFFNLAGNTIKKYGHDYNLNKSELEMKPYM